MRFFAVVAALLSAVAAETFTVIVGGNSTVTYNPTSVNATNGDIVQFQFVSKNHTVTQSSFATPCTALAGGVNSGFQAVAANATEFPVWSFTIQNASAPFWFYCQQTGHCADGMVFAVNPTAAKSFEAFQQAAIATGTNTTTTSSSTTSSTVPVVSDATSAAAVSASAAAVTGAAATTSSNGASVLSMGTTGLVTVLGLSAGLLW
ncbi:hypothetical protein BT96DRAFT_913628 [Gymnopus androsaceus JB14]|uniref:Cupredoxin n=1 Tax=Gymnopus androsaceus JB14 TaxID=1447944 RepID=A0A6A4IIW6_9AGAR|nr:hypothetical protein BT96DRAFT_913628 [Gymnopus androsaceus JB14]